MENTSHTLTRETLERMAHSELLPLPAASDDASCDVAIEDWGTLLSAVKDRLTALVSGHVDQSCGALSSSMSCVVQTSVRECVSALDQLHRTHTHERARREQLEGELQHVQLLLAQARDELAGIQAGEQRVHLLR